MVEKKKMGRPSKYKPECCPALIEHMKQGGSFEAFAAIVKTSISTIYEWLDVHEDFSEAKKEGVALSLKFWEDIAKAGITGNLRRMTKEIPMMVDKVWPDGSITKEVALDPNTKQVLYQREYAQSHFAAIPWIFTMKNRFPQYYKDTRNMAISGDGEGGAIKLRKVEPTAEEKLAEIIEVQNILKEIENANRLIGNTNK
jgi:hypothetical protein